MSDQIISHFGADVNAVEAGMARATRSVQGYGRQIGGLNNAKQRLAKTDTALLQGLGYLDPRLARLAGLSRTVGGGVGMLAAKLAAAGLAAWGLGRGALALSDRVRAMEGPITANQRAVAGLRDTWDDLRESWRGWGRAIADTLTEGLGSAVRRSSNFFRQLVTTGRQEARRITEGMHAESDAAFLAEMERTLQINEEVKRLDEDRARVLGEINDLMRGTVSTAELLADASSRRALIEEGIAAAIRDGRVSGEDAIRLAEKRLDLARMEREETELQLRMDRARADEADRLAAANARTEEEIARVRQRRLERMMTLDQQLRVTQEAGRRALAATQADDATPEDRLRLERLRLQYESLLAQIQERDTIAGIRSGDVDPDTVDWDAVRGATAKSADMLELMESYLRPQRLR